MRLFFLTLVLITLAVPVCAQSKSPFRGDKLTTSEMAAFKAMTEDDAPPARLADVKYFTLSPWQSAPQPGWVVAAMGSEPDNFDVAVLKPKGSEWEIVAITNSNNQPAVEPAEADALSGLALDLIPYRIGKKEVAFGVRVSTLFASTSTVVGSTALHLFNLQEGQLAEIFATDVDYAEEDKVAGHDKDSQSIVAFAPSQHDGHYDIIVKPAKGSIGKTVHYLWKDQHYASGDTQDAAQH